MSYILEALRKADAERERGSVPDLQSQLLPGAAVDDDTEAPRRARRWWPGAVVGVLLLAAAALWWVGTGRKAIDDAPATATSGSASLPASAVAVPAVAAASASSAVAAAPVPQPASAAVPAAAPPPKAARAQGTRPRQDSRPPTKTVSPPRAPLPTTATERKVPQVPAQAQAPSQDKDKAGTAPPEATGLVLRVNELPEELRRQLPALTVGGSVYSPQPDKRMVIFNGQVFAEGTMLTPELKLEQIRPKSAVLSIRGQRFELPL